MLSIGNIEMRVDPNQLQAAKTDDCNNIGVIILSGGQGMRMGGEDKGLCVYRQKTMVEQVLLQLQSQYEHVQSFLRHGKANCYSAKNPPPIFISANRNLDIYEKFGQPVIADIYSGFWGPLAGIESVVKAYQKDWLKPGLQQNQIKRWITYPVDSPLVPDDYLQSMAQLSSNQIGVWHAEARDHYANLSIPHSALISLSTYLATGNRSIKGWLSATQCELKTLSSRFTSACELNGQSEVKPFLNINFKADLF